MGRHVLDAAQRALPSCPHCGAGPGQPCFNPNAPRETRKPHWYREQLAAGKPIIAATRRRGLPIGYRMKEDHELLTRYRRHNGMPMHRYIVEQRIGMKIRPDAPVHHVDPDDKLTNQGLFVVCHDAAYHGIIERRGRALRECGHANWYKCYRCLRWDDPKNLILATRAKRVDLDAVHAKDHGVCVDLPEPLPIDAGVCKLSPSGRHNVGTRYDHRKRRPVHGLEARCVECERRIIRTHLDATRWYAPARQS